MSSKLTLEEVKSKTLEVMKSSDPKDVEYITQELIDLDYEDEDDFEEETEEKGITRTVVYGHNMSYDGNYYRYQRGNNPATKENACGHVKNKRISMSTWDHRSLSDKCSHGSTNHSYITKFYK